MKQECYKLSWTKRLGLISIWVAAVALGIYMNQGVAPKVQGTADYQLNVTLPIFAAFLLTLAILVGPWGVKAFFLVLLGMFWVSLVALVLLAVKSGYEEYVLTPVCRYFKSSAAIGEVTAAHLSMSVQAWYLEGYRPIECIVDAGHQTLMLNELSSSWMEMGINILSSVLVFTISLASWFVATVLLLRALWKKKPRKCEQNLDSV